MSSLFINGKAFTGFTDPLDAELEERRLRRLDGDLGRMEEPLEDALDSPDGTSPIGPNLRLLAAIAAGIGGTGQSAESIDAWGGSPRTSSTSMS
ncbi:MAG: hypothetical protein VX396_06490, partial [SAR324 cluster bacterium]|nr:hypothetical protein [SAR324 cluster bacterium]